MRFKTFPVFFLIAFAFYMMAGAAYADDDGHHAKFRRCFCLQPFEPGVEGGVEDGGFPFLKLCLSKHILYFICVSYILSYVRLLCASDQG